jgi:hypothetical protein
LGVVGIFLILKCDSKRGVSVGDFFFEGARGVRVSWIGFGRGWKLTEIFEFRRIIRRRVFPLVFPLRANENKGQKRHSMGKNHKLSSEEYNISKKKKK